MSLLVVPSQMALREGELSLDGCRTQRTERVRPGLGAGGTDTLGEGIRAEEEDGEATGDEVGGYFEEGLMCPEAGKGHMMTRGWGTAIINMTV